MLFHQLHYFCYTHITIAAVSLALSKQPPVIDALGYAFTRSPAAFGSIAGILIFSGTRIIYILSEHIFSHLTKKSMTIFYIGQAAVVVMLLSMSFITDTTLFIILWLFTGLCGGMVCTITKNVKPSEKYDKAPTTFSENAGCILGLLAAVLVSAFFGTYSPDIMLVCGAASKLAAILCIIITMQKEKKYDGIG
jgi:predicted MFS family arabinose efflux permease